MIRSISQFNNSSTVNFTASMPYASAQRTASAGTRAFSRVSTESRQIIDTYACAGGLAGSLIANVFAGMTEKPSLQWAGLHLVGLFVGVVAGCMLGITRK